MDPRLFLLDEPFSNMDPANKMLLKKIIADISQELDMSFIMTSHDPHDSLPWADEIIIMKEGRILEKNNPGEIYSAPAYAYTASLFGVYNTIPSAILPPPAEQAYENDLLYAAIVRPEHCHIAGLAHKTITMPNVETAAGSTVAHVSPGEVISLVGIVRAIHYYGHYYEINVSSGTTDLICRSVRVNYSLGDEVMINIALSDIHYVKR
jgi:iron(III) transport system ATP-binding protein